MLCETWSICHNCRILWLDGRGNKNNLNTNITYNVISSTQLIDLREPSNDLNQYVRMTQNIILKGVNHSCVKLNQNFFQEIML